MASLPHLDDDDDFGGDFPVVHGGRRTGNKRSFADLEDDDDDIFGSKKGNLKLEETAPGVATGMILSLRENLQNCKDTLSTCQGELEAAKSEVQKWHSSFHYESFVPAGTAPDPNLVATLIRNLRSSEESFKEQLDKAKKKEAAFIVTFAKREQEIAELKSTVRDLKTQLKPPSMQARRLLLDPAIHEEFTRLKSLVEEKEKKVKELLDNVAAVNFTTQSKMGKMLMAKCRTLQEENEEIGNQSSEGKMHELAMKLALQKSHNSDLRVQFEGICKHVESLNGDIEKSNEMVLILQERLEERDGEMKRMKEEMLQQQQQKEVNCCDDTHNMVGVEEEMCEEEEEEERMRTLSPSPHNMVSPFEILKPGSNFETPVNPSDPGLDHDALTSHN